MADSQVWTFRANFIYDPWNTPIMPYFAAFLPGQPVREENLRAMFSATDLEQMRTSASGKRIVRRAVIESLDTDAAVEHARKYLLGDETSLTLDVFKTGLGYADKYGLLSILELIAKWQCNADETCPDNIKGKLEVLLSKGGKIMKTETFTEIAGQQFVIAIVTYEVAVGQEARIVPLRSRKLQVEVKQ